MIEILWTSDSWSRKCPTIACPSSWYAVIFRSCSERRRVFFSGPAITRMIPSSSSSCSIVFLPRRAASSAASLTRFARSAPVKPGVPAAKASRSISLASGLPFECTSRILRRPFRSGAGGGAAPANLPEKAGPGDGEDGPPRLARARPREQRLAGAGRPVEQDALRDPRAERLELLRVLEELLDLLELLDRLVHPGHVLEADLGRVGRHPLRAALAEAHHLRPTALYLVHEEDPEPEQEDERQQAGEDRPPGRGARPLRVVLQVRVLRPSRGELSLQARNRLVGRVVDDDLLVVGRRERELALVRVEDRLVDRARLRVDPVLDLGERRLLGLVPVTGQRLDREPHQGGDHDQGEERATEEAIHEGSGRRVPATRRRRTFAQAPSGTRSGWRTPTYRRFRYRSAKSSP